MIPADAELTQRHAEIPAWDEMSDEMKPVLARQMEVYAAFMEHTDHHVGRLVGAIEDLGALEDTLVYVIVGDNGASAEGTVNGAFNEMANFNAMAELETPEFLASVLDKFGSPESYNHYSVGWAHAMNTPYQWTKQVASHWGGTRNGTIVRWPNGISARDEVRNQFSHLIDVCPTVLEVAGLPQPTMVNGIMQAPIEGTSMAYSFDAPDAPERHDLQYFEMFGNRGIYYKGWSAVTKHRTPWVMGSADVPAFDDDVWELYDGSQDWTQANDLAKEMPDRLHELQRLWLMEATKYNVLPLDDRTAERLNADIAGRPQLVRGNSQVLFGGMGRLSESSVLSIKNKSFTVTAEVVVADGAANGPIIAQGGRFGGWALYAKDGTASFVYNLLGIREFATEAAEADPGGHTSGPDGVRLRRRRAGEGRRRDAVLRRRPGGRGSRRSDPAVHLLRRRDDRRGLRRRHPRLRRHTDRAIHGDRQLGQARPRRRHPRPPRRPRPRHAGRDVAAVAKNSSISGRASGGPDMSSTRAPSWRPSSKRRNAQQRDSAAMSSRVRRSTSGVSRRRTRKPAGVRVRSSRPSAASVSMRARRAGRSGEARVQAMDIPLRFTLNPTSSQGPRC